LRPILAVVPGYGLPDLTEKCFAALRANAPDLVDIAYVDNGSKPDDKERLAELCDRFEVDHVVWNETNLGFSPAVNQGIRKRKPGQHILVMNNDAFPAPGCIERMLWHVTKKDAVGVIGPLSNCGSVHSLRLSPGRQQRFAPVIKVLHDPAEAAKRLAAIADREASRAGMICFFCALITDRAIEALGILDEKFADGLGADDDYCFRVEKAGLKLLFAADALCYHEGHQSFKRLKVPRDHQSAYRKLWAKHNDERFARGKR
jgi:GT2 family glycosyltransferase